jgi:two-component system, OmpR family, response regulator ChvI
MLAGVAPRIVLVDDDDLYREVMAGDLEDRGYAAVGFADGAALLAAVRAGLEAEAVLIDWTLPQMSGLDVLHALRAAGCGLPVAFLTGASRAEREGQAMAAGAVEFIDKTCDIDVLVETLGRIVGQARA